MSKIIVDKRAPKARVLGIKTNIAIMTFVIFIAVWTQPATGSAPVDGPEPDAHKN